MILFDIEKTCSDAFLANVMGVIKKVLNLIQIIGPILMMISLTVIFIQFMISPENKKLKGRIKNCILATVILFFLPVVISVVMYLCDDSFSFSTCWNYSEEVMVPTTSTYIDVNAGKKSFFLTDPSDYDEGNTEEESGFSSTGNGLGRAQKIKIQYNVKDSSGRCGTGSGDRCAEIATVEYPTRTVKYYMGYQNNSGLLGGSCRSHAFTCGMNAVNNTNYSTLDLQKYLYSTGDQGVLKGRARFEKVISHFDVNATAYFEETSISESIRLAGEALDNGQPVIIFVASSKCSDLASSHHALLLLGYDENGDVVFLDSCARYPSAKKRNLEELGKCMSGDSIAKNWMRMVIFSY